jgi:hypothetical protein
MKAQAVVAAAFAFVAIRTGAEPPARRRRGPPLLSELALMDDDEGQESFDRWHDRIHHARLRMDLPAEAGPPTLNWIHAGTSDVEGDARYLQDALDQPNDGLLEWLRYPSSPEAYWRSESDVAAFGVRVPIELGPRSWSRSLGDGIPENMDELLPFLKIAVVADQVVTVLGLNEEIDYVLPATFLPFYFEQLDPWARDGAVSFSNHMVHSALTDFAWHNTAVHALRNPDIDEWRASSARRRLERTTVAEVYLSELKVQRQATGVVRNAWFQTAPEPEGPLTTRTLDLALERLAAARALERDEIQLRLLEATHRLSLAEAAHRDARARDAAATGELTHRITVLSGVFLPATVIAGILGTNWSQSPLPSGWTGLALAAALTILPSSVAAALLGISQRRRRAVARNTSAIEN